MQAHFDYGRVIETPSGPVDKPGIVGWSEGITDYRALQAVRDLGTPRALRWLREVEERTDLGWWPRGYVRDDQHLELPTADMAGTRRQGLRLLERGGQ